MTTILQGARVASTDFIEAAHEYEQYRAAHTPTQNLNRLAAIGLVTASTGYGCVYAYHNSISQGWPLALVAVTFAASLEIVKPQAFAAAVSKGRDWPARVSLGILAVVACLYSLTAELQLTAMTRGDTVAARSKTITGAADKARTRGLLEQELSHLPTAQPADIAAKVTTLLTDNPKARCDVRPGDEGYGATSKRICPQVEALRSQQAAAEKAVLRRAEITRTLSEPATSSPDGTQSVDIADPGASALAAYLAVVGVSVKPEAVAEWLVLVPVLALELGSLFAGLLVASTPQPTAEHTRRTHRAPIPKIMAAAEQPGEHHRAPETLAANSNGVQSVNTVYAGVPLEPVPARTANEAGKRLVEYVRGQGGTVQISTRKLADAIACKHGTLNDAVVALEETGVLSAVPGKRGTTYMLAVREAVQTAA